MIYSSNQQNTIPVRCEKTEMTDRLKRKKEGSEREKKHTQPGKMGKDQRKRFRRDEND